MGSERNAAPFQHAPLQGPGTASGSRRGWGMLHLPGHCERESVSWNKRATFPGDQAMHFAGSESLPAWASAQGSCSWNPNLRPTGRRRRHSETLPACVPLLPKLLPAPWAGICQHAPSQTSSQHQGVAPAPPDSRGAKLDSHLLFVLWSHLGAPVTDQGSTALGAVQTQNTEMVPPHRASNLSFSTSTSGC